MKILAPVLFAVAALSSTAYALPPDIAAELNQQSANVKSASEMYDHVVVRVMDRAKAMHAVNPTKHDDMRVLAAMRAWHASTEEMLNFYLAYEDEFRQETQKYDADIASLRGDVEKTGRIVADAEHVGAIEAIRMHKLATHGHR